MEFDRFADEYREIHARNISVSGDASELFAEYKILDIVRPASGRSVEVKAVLDFGCGVGTSTPYFFRHFPSVAITGVDISKKSLDVEISRFGSQATFTCLGERSIELPNDCFDVVFTACVFHHIPWEERDLWLSELLRVTRPGGIIAILERKLWNPLTVHALNTCEFDEHARLLNSRQLERRLKKVYWNAVRHEYRIFFPRALSLLRHLEKFMMWLPFGAQYSVAAQK